MGPLHLGNWWLHCPDPLVVDFHNLWRAQWDDPSGRPPRPTHNAAFIHRYTGPPTGVVCSGRFICSAEVPALCSVLPGNLALLFTDRGNSVDLYLRIQIEDHRVETYAKASVPNGQAGEDRGMRRWQEA